jgi:phage I-like protein
VALPRRRFALVNHALVALRARYDAATFDAHLARAESLGNAFAVAHDDNQRAARSLGKKHGFELLGAAPIEAGPRLVE